jgi:hypothetical protein
MLSQFRLPLDPRRFGQDFPAFQRANAELFVAGIPRVTVVLIADLE